MIWGGLYFITNDFCLANLINAIKNNGISHRGQEGRKKGVGKKPETGIGTLSGWGANEGKWTLKCRANSDP